VTCPGMKCHVPNGLPLIATRTGDDTQGKSNACIETDIGTEVEYMLIFSISFFEPLKTDKSMGSSAARAVWLPGLKPRGSTKRNMGVKHSYPFNLYLKILQYLHHPANTPFYLICDLFNLRIITDP